VDHAELIAENFATGNDRLLRNPIRAKLWSAQPFFRPCPPIPGSACATQHKFAAYALGGYCAITTDANSSAHTGGVTPVSFLRVILVPESNLGVVILTNASMEGAFDSVLYHNPAILFRAPATDGSPHEKKKK